MLLQNCFSSRQFTKNIDESKEKDDNKILQTRKAYLIQFRSILTGYILIFDVGAHLAWSSPALSHLKSEKSEFSVTTGQGAWLASIVSLGATVGYVISSNIMNRIGRRYSILIFAILHLISWILINLARSYTFLFIARFIAGLSFAGTINLVPICIGEISEKNIRGIFLALDRIGINVGCFFITTLGAFLPYTTMNLVMISLPIVAICLFPFMTETPYYYLLKGQDEKAIETQMKLSGVTRSEIIMPDIQRMKEAMDNENSQSSSLKQLIFDRGSRKALIIVLLVLFIYAFSGTLAIQAYAQEIFKESGSSLAPEYATMIITGVQTFAGLPSTQLIDYWGRRPIYLFSGIMSAIFLGTVGLFFFIKDFLKTDVSSVTWLPLVCLVLYQFMCNSGISIMPTVYTGELFSVKVKNIAVMITLNIGTVIMFTSKMILPLLNDSFGIYTTFWTFGAVCFIGPLIVVCIVPETKGYILILDVGAHLAWSSPALSHLKSEKSQFCITTDQGAWLVSIVSLSTIFGYVISSIAMNRIGRRYSVLTFAILHLISWIFINLAKSYTFLFIARFIVGLSIAGSINLLPICIGEISEKNIRGIFLAFDRIGMNIGAFLIITLGAFFEYETMNLIMISLPILAICTFPLMSETPYYYLLKGQDEQAIKTQMKLSGVARSESVMPDIQRIKEAMYNQNSENSSIKELICDRGSRKALIIVLLASFTYPFSGTLAIQSYAQEIFKESGSSLAPEYATMIITGVQIFAGLPSTQLVDYWGRRPVYLFSGIMSAISLGTVGLFFFLKDFLKTDIHSVTWLPLVGLVLYQFMCNSGICTIPTVYSGELFSVKVKNIAVMIASNSVAVFMFTSKISFPFLNNLFGIYTTFWIFSAVCLIGPLIVVCIVPETKGRNLEEVLISLKSEKNNQRNNNISC